MLDLDGAGVLRARDEGSRILFLLLLLGILFAALFFFSLVVLFRLGRPDCGRPGAGRGGSASWTVPGGGRSLRA